MEKVGVVGLGAIGAAICWRLGASGQPVVAFDHCRPGHTLGSSHGATRIIRQAYYEHPDYVPLVRQSWQRWQELERMTGRTLLTPSAGLMLGAADSALVAGTLASVVRHDLPHQVLRADEVCERFPQFQLASGEIGLLEQHAGILRCELGVETMVRAALEADAPLTVVHQEVLALEPVGSAIRVHTSGQDMDFSQVVVAAGGWTGELLSDWQLSLTVERQVQIWFRPADPAPFRPPRLPVWMREQADGQLFYGIPAVDGDLVKVARHHGAGTTTMAHIDRVVSKEDLSVAAEFVAATLPALGQQVAEASVCAYTNTPDFHFLIGRLRATPQLVVAAGFSGHGFKFAPVIGDLVADIVRRDAPPPAILATSRFGL